LGSISPTFLQALFAPKKLQSQNVTREKLFEALLYKKFSSKMLMKLTPGADFTNILHKAFTLTKKCKKYNQALSFLRF
jgi:hypothetical protein